MGGSVLPRVLVIVGRAEVQFVTMTSLVPLTTHTKTLYIDHLWHLDFFSVACGVNINVGTSVSV